MLAHLWKRLARVRRSPRNGRVCYNRSSSLRVEPLEQRRLLTAATFAVKPYLQDPETYEEGQEVFAKIVIMWETGEDCQNQYNFVEYKLPEDENFTSIDGDINSQLRIAEIALTGLVPNQTYEFRVRSSTNGSGWGYSPSDSTTYSFNTFPDPSSPPDHFRFAVYGDSRINTQTGQVYHQFVADDIADQMAPSQNPAFVLHVGDMVNNGAASSSAAWKTEYFTPADDLLSGEIYMDESSRPAIPVIPVRGNHEYNGGSTPWYNRYMHTPPDPGGETHNEDYFAFTYGNVRAIGLNTNNGYDTGNGSAPPYTEGSDQYDWLVEQLQNTAYQTADWHIVYLHHPGYNASDGHPEPLAENLPDNSVIKQLVPLFEEYAVDFVFYGHAHVYERYL